MKQTAAWRPGPLRPSRVPAPLVTAGSGRPLHPVVAAAAEALLGHDFSAVRVYDDGAAHAASASIGADGYTIGSSIFLGARASKSTEQRQGVLAHELVHVAQQASALPTSMPAIEADNGPAEREARELGRPGTSGKRPSRLGRQAVQRQPTCNVLHPENCPVYEDWISQFAAIGAFTARDTVPVVDPRTGRLRVDPHTGRPAPPVTTGFQVLGPAAATHDPTAAPARQPIAPIGGGPGARVADRFIDRPTDDWVRHNLPRELQVMAYQLPADCADIAVILRHVWVFAHGRSEEYRGWRVGVVTGSTETARAAEINRVIGWVVDAYTAKEMVNAYTGASGQPIRSFSALAPLLHPGDVLVWEHHRGSQTGPLIGGHTQTIERVVRDEHTRAVTQVICLQGNQPIFKPQAEAILKDLGPRAAVTAGQLRDAPGRRIERSALWGDRIRDINGIWTWPPAPGDPQHEYTILMVAGPPQTVRRPSQGAQGTPLLGRPAEWMGALRSADLGNLQPRFEGALYSARAAVEGGASVLGTGSFAETDADALGRAAGERLWMLNRQRPTNLGNATHYELLYELRAVIRSIGGLARGATTRLGTIFSRIADAFNLGARGATTIEFTRRSRRGHSGQLNILLTGFDPFAGAGTPAPGQWNPSGAAVLQLDGTEVDVGGGAHAAVEGVVLPVSFAEFRGSSTTQGIVERVIGPQVANVDGVITVSENPNIDPRYEHETKGLAAPVQIEQHAAGVHQLQRIQVHPLFPPEITSGLEPIPPSPLGGGGVAAGARGAPIISTGADVAGIARDIARAGTRLPQPTIGDWVEVGFATDALATSALVALGVSTPAMSYPRRTVTPPAVPGRRLPPSRSVSVVRLTGQQVRQVAATARWATGADISFMVGRRSFDATILAGPGGDFLSNEVAYRTQRLLGASSSPRAPESFHVHTPSGGSVGVTPGATLGHARTRLANLVTTLRAIIAAFGRRLLARSAPAQPASTSAPTRRRLPPASRP